jgi:ATP-dependent DNA helicase RecQ
MRNQLPAAERMGVRAKTINSENEDERKEVESLISQGVVDILLVSPEQLANERFKTHVLEHISGSVSLLVVDEAHCISDWGHDFRPHYRLLERYVRLLPQNLRLLATTATANDRVLKDLSEVLGPNLQLSRGDLNRPSLKLQTISLPNQAERLAWLAEHVPVMPGSGIIYTLTKRDTEQVADWLKSKGLMVEAYHSDSGDRPALEDALLDNRLKALVATTSLGMGYDKPDLGFVVHYQSPGSVVAYYQQVGRAGRALDRAYGVLLSGQEESDITDFFIRTAFPSPEDVQKVLKALHDASAGLSLPGLQAKLNLSKGAIEKTLLLLSLESPAPIVKAGTKWQLTASTLSQSFWDRAERLTALRREEHQQMQAYVALSKGHMAFLIQALDGKAEQIKHPDLPDLSSGSDASLIKEAVAFLCRTNLPIEPRQKWPQGGLPKCGLGSGTNIPPVLKSQPGMALCVWRDAGWGEHVFNGKYRDNHFSDDLVQAAADLVRTWQPTPAPTWVTCIPSLVHPQLVPDFAARVAKSLGLPFHTVLMKTDHRPAQKTMKNSTYQAQNLDGSLALSEEKLPEGPVLLLDDMVDSKWTLTVAAWLLRRGGSGPVFPMALAKTGHGA